MKRVELPIRKKEFAPIAFNPNHKDIVVYVAAVKISFNICNKVYLLKKAQIAYLKIDETFTKVLSKYINMVDIFLPKLAVKFHEHMCINNYIIALVDN